MSVLYYHGLLSDRPRIEAFGRALQSAVGPEDRVLEIGTGLGTYAFFAAQAGARRVYAVDYDPIVHVAEAVAAQNGLAERVVFIRGRVPELTLPEPVDLLLFEDFPTRLLDAATWRMLRDAYARYLAPGGRVLPARARLRLAPVGASSFWPTLYPVGRDRAKAWGIDWTPSLAYVENTPQQVNLEVAHLAAAPHTLCEPGLHPLPTAEALGGECRFRIDVATEIRGLALWFDLDLGTGSWVTNAPGPDTGPWGQLLLPFDRPMAIDAGDTLTATVESRALADGAPGWLSWRAEAKGVVRRGHEFASSPAATADLLGTPGARSEPPGATLSTSRTAPVPESDTP